MNDSAPVIVHVVYRFAVGGLENGLVNLVNHLPRDAWRHAIVALTDIDAAFARRIERRDVELIALGKGPGHALPFYPRLVRLFRSLKPAIVHTRNLAALEVVPAAWLAGVAGRLHGEHGRDALDPDGTNIRRRRIRRLFRPFVSRYVAVAPDLAEYLIGPIGIPAERVDLIVNGVDTARFSPSKPRVPIPGCPFVDPGMRLVGTVGRLDPVKAQVHLARAFSMLIQRRPELRDVLRLVIVGEGSERAEVTRVLNDAGLLDRAWLPGERDDVANVLRGLDVFVLPSLAEGVSNTVLEAMATGLPVVATAVGANPYLVDDGASGRIVPAGDPVAIANALEGYVNDPGSAAAHGEAGRQLATQRFSLDRMVDRYHRLYLDLATRSAAGRRMHAANGPERHAPH